MEEIMKQQRFEYIQNYIKNCKSLEREINKIAKNNDNYDIITSHKKIKKDKKDKR